jgi:AcrR family transcriptional regulator
MSIRDPEAKRRQLLEAASAEFARHGIAGSRIDRIASAAHCSAGLVYTYFGSKDDLFDAVFDQIVARTMNDIPITVDDLPGYAGRLFDGYIAHPEVQRIASWHRLERSETAGLIPAITASMVRKTEAIEKAQEAGTLTKRLPALDLLAVLLAISSVWATTEPEVTRLTEGHSVERKRASVVAAVAALLAE